MHKYFDVARIVGTKGLSGRAILRCMGNFADIVQDINLSKLNLNVVPPQFDLAREVTVCEFQLHGSEDLIVQFKEIENVGELEGLVGCHLLGEANLLHDAGFSPNESSNLKSYLIDENLNQAIDEDESLIGWRIVDANLDFYGQIISFSDKSGQILLEVRDGDGDGDSNSDIDSNSDSDSDKRIVLIPLVDDLIDTVDIEKSTIFMSLPSGLLEL